MHRIGARHCPSNEAGQVAIAVPEDATVFTIEASSGGLVGSAAAGTRRAFYITDSENHRVRRVT